MANETTRKSEALDEKEFDTAIEQAKDAPSLVTVKFGKPVSYNGKDYTELSFDFESLTGRDALNIDTDLAMAGKITLMKETNEHYLVRFAACACVEPIGHDIFDDMPIKYYNKIMRAAQRFLLSDAD